MIFIYGREKSNVWNDKGRQFKIGEFIEYFWEF